jgi:hypothetical protein
MLRDTRRKPHFAGDRDLAGRAGRRRHHATPRPGRGARRRRPVRHSDRSRAARTRFGDASAPAEAAPRRARTAPPDQMARPGLEPGTPRFSVVGRNPSNCRESPAMRRLHIIDGCPSDVRKLRSFAASLGTEMHPSAQSAFSIRAADSRPAETRVGRSTQRWHLGDANRRGGLGRPCGERIVCLAWHARLLRRSAQGDGHRRRDRGRAAVRDGLGGAVHRDGPEIA